MKTKYEGTSPELVELAWKLKRINDEHTMKQRSLGEEFQRRSNAITEAAQVQQADVFKSIAKELGVPEQDYGEGRDWAVDIARLGEGTVALVHKAGRDECQCPACTLRRLIGGSEPESDDDRRPVVH